MNNEKDGPMRDLLGDGPQKERFTFCELKIMNQITLEFWLEVRFHISQL